MISKNNLGLTEKEIIKFTGLDASFNLCDQSLIDRVILKEFYDCIGIDFYKEIMKGLQTYEDVKGFNTDETYNVDDVVSYNGVLYIAIEESTGVIPSSYGCWALAPKFSRQCSEHEVPLGDKKGSIITKTICTCDYNEFWCSYLGPYLGFSVLKQRIPFIHNRITNDGIVRIENENIKAASQSGYNDLRIAVDSQISMLYELMIKYAKMNNVNGCYDLMKPLNISCCKSCGVKECTCDDDCETNKEEENLYNVSGGEYDFV